MMAVSQSMQRQHQTLQRRREELARLQQSVIIARQQKMDRAQRELQGAAALAASLNPYGVLARGYTIPTRNGTICPVDTLRPGQTFTLRGSDAEADCLVQVVRKIQEQGSDEA